MAFGVESDAVPVGDAADHEGASAEGMASSTSAVSFDDLDAEMKARAKRNAAAPKESNDAKSSRSASVAEAKPLNADRGEEWWNLDKPPAEGTKAAPLASSGVASGFDDAAPIQEKQPVARSPVSVGSDGIEPWPYHVQETAPSLRAPRTGPYQPPPYPHAPATIQPAGRETAEGDEAGWVTLPIAPPPDPAQKWMGQGRIQGLFPLPVIQPGPVRN